MRILFKIFAAPSVVILTISWAMLVFLFAWAELILEYVSGATMLIAIALFVTGQTTGGIVLAVVAFLLSPIGLPLIASWLIDKVADLNNALKNFITS